MKPTLFVLIALATVALAGCSHPPAGSLNSHGPAIEIVGNANNDFTPAKNPYNNTPVANPLADQACQSPPPAPQCTPASSSIRVSFSALPAATGYTVWMVGPTASVSVGELKQNGTAWKLDYAAAQDLTGKFNTVEVRLGNFVLAQASAKSGPQNAFVVPTTDLQTDVKGTYKGPDLSYTVSGLPANATFKGRLYADNGGALTVMEEFPITADGPGTFHAKQNIGSYKEFHIHVADTSINLVKTTIGA